MTKRLFHNLYLLLILFGMQLLISQGAMAQAFPSYNCETDFSISTQTFCEQDKLDKIESELKERYQRLLELLQQSSEFYAHKYKDAYYDNFEMPYDVVKEELIKSQVLWQQYVKNECQVVLKMSSRGTAKNILELQCRQNYSHKRLQILNEYFEEVRLDATSLLEMPL
ncbi:DUF1311 domain-containing protein [Ignatzschineria rhizosphaerae]|uniref:DUF1311 domain-containing protein n=1 Tax=Ignatzschineria rhizosphaerae TaxID=2923279 RepID=A0ABY3X2C3_9GAMM|nr:lysozyme inhibitor LprI family protein [Ignatzschineria rhizosphaerae]UNM97028.1 DUF1311 domain-containing protein [Ignatzschineria rhizosphaerae]